MFVNSGVKLDADALDGVPVSALEGLVLKDPQMTQQVHEILERYRDQRELCRLAFEQQVSRFERGDELPPGVIKMVKVDVAMKRKLSVGDKMAGRHGNKGVISRILPEEDMPYLEDGTPVDIVLNPLGVPSRMNVGQILETHLGWAAKGWATRSTQCIGRRNAPKRCGKDASRVFSGPVRDHRRPGGRGLREYARSYPRGSHGLAGLRRGHGRGNQDGAGGSRPPVRGQVTLSTAHTGKPFDQKVTVGIIYMMKLHHLVDDKIHARSVGPYSLITQQPLGGKAQFGGQRLGEMEVWAMEAYGAAYGLQEFLTVKSDDVLGRTRMYETIVKGRHAWSRGARNPSTSCDQELQSLCLDMELCWRRRRPGASAE